MTSYTVNAAYIIVDYAWKVLSTIAPGTWDTAKYGDLIPIVPLSEEPELEEFTGPHIVYGYAEDGTSRNHYMRSGSLTFVVYDQSFRRLTNTINLLRAAFEREDETARDINKFSTHFMDDAYLGISFGSVGIGFIEGGQPEETEAGRQSAVINITYMFTHEYDEDAFRF